ncbi:hypothetical protein AZA_56436 [Nitrospirillum viridazoti Y2]|nr:hypothetical protein AZA_56436 [Nitrospirillum amazonense Y2]
MASALRRGFLEPCAHGVICLINRDVLGLRKVQARQLLVHVVPGLFDEEHFAQIQGDLVELTGLSSPGDLFCHFTPLNRVVASR